MSKKKQLNLIVLIGIIFSILLVSFFFYLGCQPNKPNLTSSDEAAVYFLKLIKEQNYEELSHNISNSGLRLATSPYLSETNLILTPSQVAKINSNSNQFNFGQSDGSGEPIMLTLQEFFERYVYSHDYLAIDQSSLPNQQIYHSSTLNNIEQIYPNSTIQTHTYPGSSQFDNMDWQKLNLVIEAEPSGFKLKALVNEEWTI